MIFVGYQIINKQSKFKMKKQQKKSSNILQQIINFLSSTQKVNSSQCTVTKMRQKLRKIQSQLQIQYQKQKKYSYLEKKVRPFYSKLIKPKQNHHQNKLNTGINHQLNLIIQQITQDIKLIDSGIPQNRPINKINCNIKQHIKHYLQPQQQNSKYNSLKSTLQNLLQKTSNILQKQEPYLHQKLFNSIQQEIKTCGKIIVGKQLRKQINKLKESNNKMQGTNVSVNQQRSIQEMISQNLQILKQIKNKKIYNNDQMFSWSKCLMNRLDRIKIQAKQNLDKYKQFLQRSVNYKGIQKVDQMIVGYGLRLQKQQQVVTGEQTQIQYDICPLNLLKASQIEEGYKKIERRFNQIKQKVEELNRTIINKPI